MWPPFSDTCMHMYIHHTLVHIYKLFSPFRVSCMYVISGLTTWLYWITIQGTHPRENYFSHFELFLLPIVLYLWWGPMRFPPAMLVCLLLFRGALDHFTCTRTCAHTHIHTEFVFGSYSCLTFCLVPPFIGFFLSCKQSYCFLHTLAHTKICIWERCDICLPSS